MRVFLLLTLFPLTASPLKISEETIPIETQRYFLSLKSAFEHISGERKKAAHSYQILNQLQLESPAFQHATIRLNFEQGNHTAVIEQTKKMTGHTKDTDESFLFAAQSLLATGKPHEAQHSLYQLKKHCPHDDRIEYYLVAAHTHAHEYAAAHKLIDTIFLNNSYPNKHFLFYFLKAKLHLLEEHLQPALETAKKSLFQNPTFGKTIILLGSIEEKLNHKAEALSYFEKYVQQSPDAEVIKKVISLAFALHEYQKAEYYLAKYPQGTADYWHDRALVAHMLKQENKALTFLKCAFKRNPLHQQSQELNIEILLKKGRDSDIIKLFARWIYQEPSNIRLIRHCYRIALQNISSEKVIPLLRTIAKTRPTLPLCFALGDLLHSTQKYCAARYWYHNALKYGENLNTATKSALHFQIARTYYIEKKLGKAARSLCNALQSNAPYLSTYNLAAIIIIERNNNLSLAQKILNKALKQAPHYPPYLRTQKVITQLNTRS